ncbi:MAG: transposase [Balneolaceae bacterium]|nr:transposase [Balneolaceae bacterium]
MNHRNQHKNRRSIRLKGYDYSSPGEYFITICIQNRECLFGDILNGEMVLNEIGDIAQDFWYRIPERYDDVITDAFVVMPNHIHGIIGIEYNPDHVPHPVGAIHELPLRDGETNYEAYRKQRRQMLLSKIIGWYKMNVAKRANILLENTGNRFWQRNYYEHIIRNERSLNRIRDYIINNPIQWVEDINHPDNIITNT